MASKHGGARGTRDLRNHAGPILVCAWCRQAARVGTNATARGTQWQKVSLAFVSAVQRTGLASHGLCDACRPAVVREWGIPALGRAGTTEAAGDTDNARTAGTTKTTAGTTRRAA